MLESIWQDIRYIFRSLKGNPKFGIVAILSLALGIGANTAIYSLMNAVIFKPLPVQHPEELVQVVSENQFFSNPLWEMIRDRQQVFSGVFAYGRWRFNLANGGEARYANGQFVSGQYFETLGVHPHLGRTLNLMDDQRSCTGAAVLSYSFWQKEYAGQPDVLGKLISLNKKSLEIVGVSELRHAGIDVGNSVDVFVPLCAEKLIQGESSMLDLHAVPGMNGLVAQWLRIVGRPENGISISQVNAHLHGLASEIYKDTLPASWDSTERNRYLQKKLNTLSVENGISMLRSSYRKPLLILMVAVGIVLLIACVNLANLLLARSEGRRHEITVRMAMGADRIRLLRQFLTESLLLASSGALLGILFAQWLTSLLVVFMDAHLDLTPDARVLGFTAGVTILASILFGAVPALRSSDPGKWNILKTHSGSVRNGWTFGVGKAFIATQVALSFVLVAGAGLMITTFWKLISHHPGFDKDQVLLMDVDVRNIDIHPESRQAIVYQVVERIRAVPGINSASLSSIAPLCGCSMVKDVVFDEREEGAGTSVRVHHNQVSDHYFQTLGLGIISGRDFSQEDVPSSFRVGLMNRAAANRYFGKENPLGRMFKILQGPDQSHPIQIIGIVDDAKFGSLREEIPPTIYTAWRQETISSPSMVFQIRATDNHPSAMIPAIKSVITDADQNISVEFSTLAHRVDQLTQREFLLAMMSGFFGVVALLLAAIGIYGVVSYDMAQRQNEIGIRMALGADRGQILSMVFKDMGSIVIAGLGAGLAIALATTHLVNSLLYGLTPNDPIIFTFALIILTGVALLAGYLPARRASGIDPMSALRGE